MLSDEHVLLEGVSGTTTCSNAVMGRDPLPSTGKICICHSQIPGVTLVDNSTGLDICERVWSEEYGVLYCKTKKGVINNGTIIAAKSLKNQKIEDCIGDSQNPSYVNTTTNCTDYNVTEVSSNCSTTLIDVTTTNTTCNSTVNCSSCTSNSTANHDLRRL